METSSTRDKAIFHVLARKCVSFDLVLRTTVRLGVELVATA